MKSTKNRMKNSQNFILRAAVVAAGAGVCLFATSCATLFTPSEQSISFRGPNGTRIYENDTKIAEIKNREVSVMMKKSTSSKILTAKKEGYKPYIIHMTPQFEMITVLDVFFWPGFIVDAVTQKMCRWPITQFDIKPEKESDGETPFGITSEKKTEDETQGYTVYF